MGHNEGLIRVDEHWMCAHIDASDFLKKRGNACFRAVKLQIVKPSNQRFYQTIA